MHNLEGQFQMKATLLLFDDSISCLFLGFHLYALAEYYII